MNVEPTPSRFSENEIKIDEKDVDLFALDDTEEIRQWAYKFQLMIAEMKKRHIIDSNQNGILKLMVGEGEMENEKLRQSNNVLKEELVDAVKEIKLLNKLVIKLRKDVKTLVDGRKEPHEMIKKLSFANGKMTDKFLLCESMEKVSFKTIQSIRNAIINIEIRARKKNQQPTWADARSFVMNSFEKWSAKYWKIKGNLNSIERTNDPSMD